MCRSSRLQPARNIIEKRRAERRALTIILAGVLGATGMASIALLPAVATGQEAVSTVPDSSQPRMSPVTSETSRMKTRSAAQSAKANPRTHTRGKTKQASQAKPTKSANQNLQSNGKQPLALLAGAVPPRALPAKPPVTPPVAATIPVITYFNQDAQKWLRAGETVYVTMQGTSGAQAVFHVGTLSGNVVMREASPGQYLGSWMVPADKPLPTTPFTVMGELRANGKAADPMPASRALQIDAMAPTIANLSPLETTSATPAIAADLRDEGSGIDIASIHLRVNGRDVTGSAQVTADHIMYTPMLALSEGEQTVELQVSDRAGNRTMQTWRFTVK